VAMTEEPVGADRPARVLRAQGGLPREYRLTARERLAIMGMRQIFYARLPEVKGTAGTAAFIVDEALPASPAFEWTLNHIIPVDDPMEFFDVHIIEAGK